jgi:pyridoxamine 5'-phosphate oxidase
MTIHAELLPTVLPEEPLTLFAAWLEAAMRSRAQPNPNAMVLATADAHGMPSARVVLCKELQILPGYVTFYTHYDSRKGRELAANPRAAAVIHWDSLHRQVRLEGNITRVATERSDTYFASRSWQSRLSALASAQSEPIDSRAAMENAVEVTAARFAAPSPLRSDGTAPDPGIVIPRPTHWGGYHLWMSAVELWVEGAGRLHDRARWQRTLTAVGGGFEAGPWSATRLQP